MTEWWAYTLSDFLLFSPRTYYRLFELHNAAVWPGHVLTLGLGLIIAGLLRRPTAGQGRLTPTVIAILWAWVGWAFLWQRYATINWAAIYLLPLFAVEVLLLLWVGLIRGGLSMDVRRDTAGIVGLGLFILGLAIYPALAPLLGRGWQQAEVFGVAPDPTAIATLGLVLLTEGRPRWELLAAPVLWCLVSGATLLAMGSPEAWVLLPAGMVTVGASGIRRKRER